MKSIITTAVRSAALAMLVAVGSAGAGAAQDHAHDAGDGGEHGHMGQMPEGGGMMHGHGAEAGGSPDAEHEDPEAPLVPLSPATEAYRAANLAMHSAMDIEFSGDADIDFARGMIGHHQGAIDMARIVLEHGQDPDLRQLAEEIIEAQEAEIAFLRGWIAEHAPE